MRDLSSTTRKIPAAEYSAVVEAMTGYIEGMDLGDFDRITDTFHPDAIMYASTPNGFVEGPYVPNLKGWVEEFGKPDNAISRVDVLALTPTTAVVRVDMDGAADGADYVDFHTLIKVDDGWKVIAKVYHLY